MWSPGVEESLDREFRPLSRSHLHLFSLGGHRKGPAWGYWGILPEARNKPPWNADYPRAGTRGDRRRGRNVVEPIRPFHSAWPGGLWGGTGGSTHDDRFGPMGSGDRGTHGLSYLSISACLTRVHRRLTAATNTCPSFHSAGTTGLRRTCRRNR